MQLIRYFIILLFTSCIIAAGFTYLCNAGLRKSGVDFYEKINTAADTGKRPDILLIGSSRTLVQLDPAIIDRITGLHTYNYGLNASTIKTSYNIIKTAVTFQRNIRMVVLNIDYNMFSLKEDPYKDAYYYPFEKQVTGLLKGGEKDKNVLHRARIFDVTYYDDYVKYAAIDGWLRPNRISAGSYKGYQPHRTTIFEAPSDIILKNPKTISEKGLPILKSCIELCKKNNIRIVLIVAPYFQKYSPEKYISNFDAIMNQVRSIASENNVRVINFAKAPFAAEEQYFYNVNHLNEKGAILYSNAVADSLRQFF